MFNVGNLKNYVQTIGLNYTEYLLHSLHIPRPEITPNMSFCLEANTIRVPHSPQITKFLNIAGPKGGSSCEFILFL